MNELEMEREIVELKKKKSDLVQAKLDLNAKLTEINSKCSTRINSDDFRKLQRERSSYVSMITEIEGKIRPISMAISRLSAEKCAPDSASSASSEYNVDAVQMLVRIRDEYQAFAADKTRVGSMRQMASEFVLKMNPVIRKFMKSNY